MKREWRDTPRPAKIAAVVSIIVCLAVVALSVLEIFDMWNNAGFVSMPLLGVNMFLQAYIQWKQIRGVAIFSLCTGVFIMACSICALIFMM